MCPNTLFASNLIQARTIANGPATACDFRHLCLWTRWFVAQLFLRARVITLLVGIPILNIACCETCRPRAIRIFAVERHQEWPGRGVGGFGLIAGLLASLHARGLRHVQGIFEHALTPTYCPTLQLPVHLFEPSYVFPAQLYSRDDTDPEGAVQRTAAYLHDFTFSEATIAGTMLTVVGVAALVLRPQRSRAVGWNPTGVVLLTLPVFYLAVFHSLSNMPLGEDLLYGVHERFWQQVGLRIPELLVDSLRPY